MKKIKKTDYEALSEFVNGTKSEVPISKAVRALKADSHLKVLIGEYFKTSKEFDEFVSRHSATRRVARAELHYDCVDRYETHIPDSLDEADDDFEQEIISELLDQFYCRGYRDCIDVTVAKYSIVKYRKLIDYNRYLASTR
jgi:hypothetical protein